MHNYKHDINHKYSSNCLMKGQTCLVESLFICKTQGVYVTCILKVARQSGAFAYASNDVKTAFRPLFIKIK